MLNLVKVIIESCGFLINLGLDRVRGSGDVVARNIGQELSE